MGVEFGEVLVGEVGWRSARAEVFAVEGPVDGVFWVDVCLGAGVGYSYLLVCMRFGDSGRLLVSHFHPPFNPGERTPKVKEK